MKSEDEILLGPTEWRIMRSLWDLRSADPVQIAERLRTRYGFDYSPQAAGIFLRRLAEKGYACFVIAPAVGRGRPRHVYSPLIGEEEALRRQVLRFLQEYLIDDDRLDLVESVLDAQRSLQSKLG